mmetsp:Transcript_21484/g.54075  ORF Transcript_21484/g.54075 Transcript_21484/m.54075 type:complete len:812 (-) Transcript_21484:602-3037(-)|eukprot:CAMPEP_0178987270 /NCGR_PEP_ID=MMETSP0795-20121207/3171_1 /TAXON_ID=88552 /ORGANISM="Amoebophrya sp., Strain Ameob2" /LENGTH=811 /DNA_ID=CAMNT_0020678433 /DNA_START=355 /DNA_END=2790 /DNA_ORIENTATION=+
MTKLLSLLAATPSSVGALRFQTATGNSVRDSEPSIQVDVEASGTAEQVPSSEFLEQRDFPGSSIIKKMFGGGAGAGGDVEPIAMPVDAATVTQAAPAAPAAAEVKEGAAVPAGTEQAEGVEEAREAAKAVHDPTGREAQNRFLDAREKLALQSSTVQLVPSSKDPKTGETVSYAVADVNAAWLKKAHADWLKSAPEQGWAKLSAEEFQKGRAVTVDGKEESVYDTENLMKHGVRAFWLKTPEAAAEQKPVAGAGTSGSAADPVDKPADARYKVMIIFEKNFHDPEVAEQLLTNGPIAAALRAGYDVIVPTFAGTQGGGGTALLEVGHEAVALKTMWAGAKKLAGAPWVKKAAGKVATGALTVAVEPVTDAVKSLLNPAAPGLAAGEDALSAEGFANLVDTLIYAAGLQATELSVLVTPSMGQKMVEALALSGYKAGEEKREENPAIFSSITFLDLELPGNTAKDRAEAGLNLRRAIRGTPVQYMQSLAAAAMQGPTENNIQENLNAWLQGAEDYLGETFVKLLKASSSPHSPLMVMKNAQTWTETFMWSFHEQSVKGDVPPEQHILFVHPAPENFHRAPVHEVYVGPKGTSEIAMNANQVQNLALQVALQIVQFADMKLPPHLAKQLIDKAPETPGGTVALKQELLTPSREAALNAAEKSGGCGEACGGEHDQQNKEGGCGDGCGEKQKEGGDGSQHGKEHAAAANGSTNAPGEAESAGCAGGCNQQEGESASKAAAATPEAAAARPAGIEPSAATAPAAGPKSSADGMVTATLPGGGKEQDVKSAADCCEHGDEAGAHQGPAPTAAKGGA